jgi:hypothetical protein
MITYIKGISLSNSLKVLLVVGLGLLVHPIIAGELPNPQIKRIYTDEDAPPEIRFRHLFTVLAMDDERADDRTSRRLVKLGFEPEDVPRIHEYLIALREEAQVEINRGIWRLACHSEAHSLAGLEIRVVYNSFDDLRFAVAAKYLAIASAELASMGYPDFLNMIGNYPGGAGSSFKTISTDHRFAWGETDFGIQENRAAICQGLINRVGTSFN